MERRGHYKSSTTESETTAPGSRVASTAHAETGKTALPYTNVDRWDMLRNRGLYFSTRSPYYTRVQIRRRARRQLKSEAGPPDID